jgi:hypothetical protein
VLTLLLAFVWLLAGVFWGLLLVRDGKVLGRTHLTEAVTVNPQSATIDIIVTSPATNQVIRTHVHDPIPQQ